MMIDYGDFWNDNSLKASLIYRNDPNKVANEQFWYTPNYITGNKARRAMILPPKTANMIAQLPVGRLSSHVCEEEVSQF